MVQDGPHHDDAHNDHPPPPLLVGGPLPPPPPPVQIRVSGSLIGIDPIAPFTMTLRLGQKIDNVKEEVKNRNWGTIDRDQMRLEVFNYHPGTDHALGLGGWVEVDKDRQVDAIQKSILPKVKGTKQYPNISTCP